MKAEISAKIKETDRIIRILYKDSPKYCIKLLVKYWLDLDGGRRGDSLYAVCRKNHGRILYGMCTNIIKRTEYKWFEKRLMWGMARAYEKSCKRKIKSTFKNIIKDTKPLGFYLLCRLLQLCSGDCTTFTLDNTPQAIKKFIEEIVEKDLYKVFSTKRLILYQKRMRKTACLELIPKTEWEYENEFIFDNKAKSSLYKEWINNPYEKLDSIINSVLSGKDFVSVTDLIIAGYLIRFLVSIRKTMWMDTYKIKRYIYDIIGIENDELFSCIMSILKEVDKKQNENTIR